MMKFVCVISIFFRAAKRPIFTQKAAFPISKTSRDVTHLVGLLLTLFHTLLDEIFHRQTSDATFKANNGQ